MKYGFIIDNRKCIGCHACTVACKSEHDVPIGVNRTWVKQVEKGQYPDTQRLFSVMRCNHCTNAPCVEICPVEALHVREDGIVDFDNSRCIGCKACTQACPYDALYIDPETNTAAKCNYCSHRVEIGLEPACVNVCPEHAIISGDMEDPESEISHLLSTQKVTVRKPEKGTEPNLFYINGDDAALTPSLSRESDDYLWNSQTGGVGHFAKYADYKKQQSDPEAMKEVLAGKQGNGQKQIQAIMSKSRRVYDAPAKGTLWGWEVSTYVWTKAISTGAFLVPFLALGFGLADVSETIKWTSIVLGLVFLTLTGGFLVKDLDQPTRFIYVLLRPQWKSWLVRGGYAITVFGGLITLWAVSVFMGWGMVETIALWAGAALAILTSIYTAFLFAQAKSRDFWQSPALSLHMLLHSFMAGAAVFGIFSMMSEATTDWTDFLNRVLMISVGVNLFTMLLELATPHGTIDAKKTVKMIVSGRYKNLFWVGVVVFGNILPMVLAGTGLTLGLPAASVLVLMGMYITEHIWVQAPQQIPLS